MTRMSQLFIACPPPLPGPAAPPQLSSWTAINFQALEGRIYGNCGFPLPALISLKGLGFTTAHIAHLKCRTEMNSYRTGRMMEYVWHIIFGEAHIMEAVKECDLLYCAVTF